MNDENDRLTKLAETAERLMECSVEGSFGPGTLGYHELIDRAFLMLDNWGTFIASHPSTLLDPQRYRKAQEISAAMADFYQLVGSDDREPTAPAEPDPQHTDTSS